MVIAGWIIGGMLVAVGTVWALLAGLFHKLSTEEARAMVRHGKLWNEPEYMRTFRVIRALGDAADANKQVNIGIIIVCVGVGLLLALIARGLAFGTWFN
ncbi:MAG: hypothetical protein HY474_01590 [Candidatus Sungbacteria bacterium]|uniref:Uncharacterized protein n=1 Tax=Candidatus Sungiibacteriota bacterium TaxID=2750080 RepID=A0A932YVW1_9BACT|nr:hypothetical protein [Candidatus Sungbacteria bacterium]